MVRSKKKNKIYERPSSVSQIIRKSETSADDLERLSKRLGINVRIVWRKDYDPKLKRNPNIGQIINMGSPMIGGSHWTAAYRDKYFDSLSMPPPPNMKHLQWTPLQIQDMMYGHCGQYSLYWIYYQMIGEEDKFYAMFHPENIQ